MKGIMKDKASIQSNHVVMSTTIPNSGNHTYPSFLPDFSHVHMTLSHNFHTESLTMNRIHTAS